MYVKDLENLGEQYSVLIITSIDNIQDATNETIRYFTDRKIPGIYVCFNKPQKAIKRILEAEKINTEKIFFVDCITSAISEVENEENVLHISNPADLTSLSIAISEFVEKIPSEKFLVIDALSSLLIYNTENLVVKFVKSVIEESGRHGLKTVMFTTEPRGGNFMNKVSLFFDKIIK